MAAPGPRGCACLASGRPVGLGASRGLVPSLGPHAASGLGATRPQPARRARRRRSRARTAKRRPCGRTTIAGHLLPDWAAIAEDYEGVHLSWAGYLAAEGLV